MKILVPIDYSPASKKAFQYALFLSERSHVDITLLHVFDLPAMATDSYVYIPPSDEIEKIKSGHKVRLEKFASANKGKSTRSIHINYQSAYGIPSDQILDYSINEPFDLIIMGIQGKCIRPNFFMGTTFSKVMQKADIPVIALHGNSEFHRLRHILFTYDLKKFSDSKILNPILRIAKDFGAKIHVLHVTDSIKERPSLALKLISKDLKILTENDAYSSPMISLKE
jgi:nucleotide-binding universal stress UspA family protein